MSQEYFTLDIDDDGHAILTWDTPDQPVNLLGYAALAELNQHVRELSNDDRVKGIVLTSAKPSFSTGVDMALVRELVFVDGKPRCLSKKKNDGALFGEVCRLSAGLRELETCGKPIVAAIAGATMASAVDLVLSCHARIAADTFGTRFSHPETRVGLFPGAGAAQRLLRMTSDQQGALDFLMGAQEISAREAKSLGLVDEVVPAKRLLEAAKRRLSHGVETLKAWDRPKAPRPFNPFMQGAGAAMWASLIAKQRAKFYDNYPHLRAFLSSIYEGLSLPFDQALQNDARWMSYLMQQAETASMVRTLFFSRKQLQAGARRPSGQRHNHIKRVGILGAGHMGAGIAFISAKAGMRVHMLDVDQASADAGKARCEAMSREAIERGELSQWQMDRLLAHIETGIDYSVLTDCDLVIEAVVEDRKVKRLVTEKAAKHMKPRATFASDTSTLPIASLSTYFPRPKNFVGLHFFTPADQMQLVEIVRSKETSPKTLSVAMDFVSAIERTPIVVEDGRAFYTSRVIMTYAGEAAHMLRDGVPPTLIENAGKASGMPMGPFQLADEVALDHALNIAKAARQDLGKRFSSIIPHELLEEMVVNRKRLGKKCGKGFYDYGENGERRLWSGIADICGPFRPAEDFDFEELKQRFLVIQSLETARVIEEKRVTDIREADVGSILGYGFAPFTGGTVSYIDAMGTPAFADLCKTLQKRWGDRFKPTRLLREMVRRDERFYERFAQQDFADQPV
ncbi:3-hydroxyacyl-CoA dehydrogenase [Rhodobacteraceae bacterium RKSG542]|uniref:3-hydroxyacyl-CoA dehydrogenase NAD-binding domain-containing protein n=1 Tax=Pseudovibrio flavus TaxID=2529854 RepID=UPI0012BCF6DC|nr:3-hydroxyacyl-CoA dehydrogenase NAD-binding domain-containing protein [Pseudovibrio flavus]MTI18801.1 3-hydroxyacyl-CoA dehydrogenase [Pseudovibrio flavus]